MVLNLTRPLVLSQGFPQKCEFLWPGASQTNMANCIVTCGFSFSLYQSVLEFRRNPPYEKQLLLKVGEQCWRLRINSLWCKHSFQLQFKLWFKTDLEQNTLSSQCFQSTKRIHDEDGLLPPTIPCIQTLWCRKWLLKTCRIDARLIRTGSTCEVFTAPSNATIPSDLWPSLRDRSIPSARPASSSTFVWICCNPTPTFARTNELARLHRVTPANIILALPTMNLITTAICWFVGGHGHMQGIRALLTDRYQLAWTPTWDEFISWYDGAPEEFGPGWNVLIWESCWPLLFMNWLSGFMEAWEDCKCSFHMHVKRLEIASDADEPSSLHRPWSTDLLSNSLTLSDTVHLPACCYRNVFWGWGEGAWS